MNSSSIANSLASFELDKKDINKDDKDPFEEFLAVASHVICSVYYTILGMSPSELAFDRNMFMPVYKQIDWDVIKL